MGIIRYCVSAVPCEPGHYSDTGAECKPCGTEQYQNESGHASCKMCPELTYTDDMGSSAVNACMCKSIHHVCLMFWENKYPIIQLFKSVIESI